MKPQGFPIWGSHWTDRRSKVFSSLVFIDSHDSVAGKIAFVRRSSNSVSLAELALRAQTASAVAVCIVDDGKCSKYDQRCIPGASRHWGEGFAMQDMPVVW
jgi:hypothetical protein